MRKMNDEQKNIETTFEADTETASEVSAAADTFDELDELDAELAELSDASEAEPADEPEEAPEIDDDESDDASNEVAEQTALANVTATAEDSAAAVTQPNSGKVRKERKFKLGRKDKEAKCKDKKEKRPKKNKQEKRTLGVRKTLSTPKKIAIAVISVLAVFAAAAAVMYFSSGAGKSVYVVNVSELDQSSYGYGMENSSSGIVTAENIQAEYPSDSMTIKEIYVSEGDTVKKGDLIMTYDTTLDALEVDKKDLEVTQMELELANLKKQLAEINRMKPSNPNAGSSKPKPEENPTGELVLTRKIVDGDGSEENPYICVIAGTQIPCDEDFLNTLFDSGSNVYVVFENRTANKTGGHVNNAWGVNFVRGDSGTSFNFFDASEYIYVEEEEEIDYGSGYTAAEIAKMRQETQKQITEKDLEVRMAKVEVAQLHLELNGGEVYSEVDGVVTQVLDEQTAKEQWEPVVKISGGGGFYISGTVSELKLGEVNIGDPVTIVSYETGMEYEGTVAGIIDMPSESEDMYFYGESAQASVYPMSVFVDEEANLRPDEYVAVNMKAADETAIYIESVFVFQQNGINYVYVQGKDGLLEQRRVSVAGTMYGYLTMIDGGITVDDYIAFPYGNNVRDGAKVEQCTLDEFYNHMYGY